MVLTLASRGARPRNDRVAELERLVARGAGVDAGVYRGTALGWAAACGHLAAIASR